MAGESGKASRRRWYLGEALKGGLEFDNAVMTGRERIPG